MNGVTIEKERIFPRGKDMVQASYEKNSLVATAKLYDAGGVLYEFQWRLSESHLFSQKDKREVIGEGKSVLWPSLTLRFAVEYEAVSLDANRPPPLLREILDQEIVIETKLITRPRFRVLESVTQGDGLA